MSWRRVLGGRQRARRAGLRPVPGWAGVDLDTPWREAEFVVVDVETTGLDLRRDEIVSFGAVTVRGGRVVVASSVYELVRPTRPISPAAVGVHGLREVDLADAPGAAQRAPELAGLLAGRVLVAHSAWVEERFLDRALEPAGARFEGPVVCTAALARETDAVRTGPDGDPQLERLAAGLGLPVHTPHHALGDALTTATVLLALVARLEAREPQTVGSLVTATRRRGRR